MGSEHGHQQVSTPPEEIKKLLAKAKVQVPSESPKFPSSISAGAAQISIEGRYRIDRARLGPNFTEADRQWRIKYIKSQDLHPNEPFEVPELERVHYNPIRRFYRVPMNLFENAISKIIVSENQKITFNLKIIFLGQRICNFYKKTYCRYFYWLYGGIISLLPNFL